jgi:hypothetical protein
MSLPDSQLRFNTIFGSIQFSLKFLWGLIDSLTHEREFWDIYIRTYGMEGDIHKLINGLILLMQPVPTYVPYIYYPQPIYNCQIPEKINLPRFESDAHEYYPHAVLDYYVYAPEFPAKRPCTTFLPLEPYAQIPQELPDYQYTPESVNQSLDYQYTHTRQSLDFGENNALFSDHSTRASENADTLHESSIESFSDIESVNNFYKPNEDGECQPYKKRTRYTRWKSALAESEPTCFSRFDIDVFIYFIKSRNSLDDQFQNITDYCLIDALPYINQLKEMALSIANSPENLFDNTHMIAYFYKKLANLALSVPDRVEIMKVLMPKFSIKRSVIENIYSWGTILEAGHDLQWLGGIDHRGLKHSTVKKWIMQLKEYSGNRTFSRVVVEGNVYYVPLKCGKLTN